jgi:hypothetical protein
MPVPPYETVPSFRRGVFRVEPPEGSTFASAASTKSKRLPGATQKSLPWPPVSNQYMIHVMGIMGILTIARVGAAKARCTGCTSECFATTLNSSPWRACMCEPCECRAACAACPKKWLCLSPAPCLCPAPRSFGPPCPPPWPAVKEIRTEDATIAEKRMMPV